MEVTFCGHSKFYYEETLKDEIFNTLEMELMNYNDINFYLGANGEFDKIALQACLMYKQKHNKVKLYFVTPYLNDVYLKNRKEIINNFDEVIYPELEKVHKRYAIIKRNYWLVNKCDLIISFVKYPWGGASKMLEYAVKKNKKIINLSK